MTSAFTKLNGFTAASNGVYHGHDDEREFNYSDGATSEIQLRQILVNSADLSSDSPELAKQITDWPTEYHLSPTRANLIRPLNLDGVERILELGCGCGSITRYLAEASTAQIDAVEGSPIRADLARLRCKGKDKVTISTANFNEVEFPENYYDLILFVGVTEYAGRFSECETDQEALQSLLALAKRASKPGGVTLIAIENRTGLKYVEGACEDHYGQPFIGINNYPESTGIRTYTRTEWLSELAQAGFAAQQFIYPFPDYKIPTLLLHHNHLEKSADALTRVKSRDYVAPFDLGSREPGLWQDKLKQGRLSEYANSFLILVAEQQPVIDAMADFDVAEYAQFKAQYLSPQPPVVTVEEPNEHLQANVTQSPNLLGRVLSKIKTLRH